MEQYVLNTVQGIIENSKDILMPEEYLNSKRKRIELAGFYKSLLNIGSEYPKRPDDMHIKTANILYKDVCNTCPTKVRPSTMKQSIVNAIRLIYKYIAVLKDWIKGVSLDGKPKSVHDLRPNI